MEQLGDGFRVFAPREMYEIHCAAMDVVGSCGLEICHEGLLRMADRSGMRVDSRNQRIYLEAEDVLETIRQKSGADTPEITEAGAQKPALRRRIVSRIETAVGANYGFVVEADGDSWKLRPTTCEDVKDFFKVRRALGCVEAGPGLIPQDVPPEVSPIHAAAIAAKYSRGVGTPDCKDVSDMEWLTRVMQASGRWDENEEFHTYACVRSPLCLVGRDADIVYYEAKRGWLSHIVGVPIFGATSPCTLAADIVLRLAETFGFLTFSRLITQGPCNPLSAGAFGSYPIELDLMKGNLIMASPRARLCRIALTQIQGEFYKMRGARPGMDIQTDAAEPGVQACMEKALSAFATLPLGVYTDSDGPVTGHAGLGQITANLAVSAEQAVLDSEMVSYLNKFLEGIRVDEDTLAVDVIKDVGPSGEFVSTDHTFRYFHEASWASDLFHRGPWDAWVSGGRKGPLAAAREKVEEALKMDLPLMIPEENAREVDRVVAEAEEALLQ